MLKLEKGKGRWTLLRDAIINASKVAAIAGARALVVDPVDDSAAAFYGPFRVQTYRRFGPHGHQAAGGMACWASRRQAHLYVALSPRYPAEWHGGERGLL